VPWCLLVPLAFGQITRPPKHPFVHSDKQSVSLAGARDLNVVPIKRPTPIRIQLVELSAAHCQVLLAHLAWGDRDGAREAEGGVDEMRRCRVGEAALTFPNRKSIARMNSFCTGRSSG
jgi:hypothetical protein